MFQELLLRTVLKGMSFQHLQNMTPPKLLNPIFSTLLAIAFIPCAFPIAVYAVLPAALYAGAPKYNRGLVAIVDFKRAPDHCSRDAVKPTLPI
jgi:hypothetical protein